MSVCRTCPDGGQNGSGAAARGRFAFLGTKVPQRGICCFSYADNHRRAGKQAVCFPFYPEQAYRHTYRTFRWNFPHVCVTIITAYLS